MLVEILICKLHVMDFQGRGYQIDLNISYVCLIIAMTQTKVFSWKFTSAFI